MSDRRNRNIEPDAQTGNAQQNNNGSTNSGNYNNSNGQSNANNFSQMFNNIDLNQIMGQLSQMMGGGAPGGFQGNPQMPPRQTAPRDPRLQLLQSMKPFLNKKRGTMIDSIGQLYAIAKIIRGNGRR